jgi:NAD+ synthase (glutamine-hydrolysing)
MVTVEDSDDHTDGAVSLTDMATLRIGLAQMNPTVGDLAGNRALIAGLYAEAVDAKCDIVAFSELSVTGYPPEDLVLKSGFVRDNRIVLEDLAKLTGSCIAVIGFVDRGIGEQTSSGQPVIYNAAAVCSHGVIQGVYHKRHLPNYDVFDEERTFAPGSGEHQIFEVAGINFAVSICEDIWRADGPVTEQARSGAQVNININGSPFHSGKLMQRQEMLSGRARENNCAIVYVNQVGGQDELVFDGSSMVFDAAGKMLARAPQFVAGLTVVELDLASTTNAQTTIAPISSRYEEMYGALVLGTRDYVRKNKFTDVVIGLSGGIDSSIVAALAVEALGAEHVHGVAMPSRYSSDGSKTDAYALADALGIDCQTISIEPVFEAYLAMLAPSFAGREADLTEENLQSRCRGQILMALSNKFGWMVLTTGNKSELAVGYFTIYGDSVGGYAVIKDLLKTDVFGLSRYVNERAGREIIPESVLTKPPSAELRPDQRDDQSLPPYDILDPILALYVEQDRTAAEIIELGHPEDIVRRIARLVDLSEYKRRQGAPGVRVSEKAFGKDRRLPITNGYRG